MRPGGPLFSLGRDAPRPVHRSLTQKGESPAFRGGRFASCGEGLAFRRQGSPLEAGHRPPGADPSPPKARRSPLEGDVCLRRRIVRLPGRAVRLSRRAVRLSGRESRLLGRGLASRGGRLASRGERPPGALQTSPLPSRPSTRPPRDSFQQSSDSMIESRVRKRSFRSRKRSFRERRRVLSKHVILLQEPTRPERNPDQESTTRAGFIRAGRRRCDKSAERVLGYLCAGGVSPAHEALERRAGGRPGEAPCAFAAQHGSLTTESQKTDPRWGWNGSLRPGGGTERPGFSSGTSCAPSWNRSAARVPRVQSEVHQSLIRTGSVRPESGER